MEIHKFRGCVKESFPCASRLKISGTVFKYRDESLRNVIASIRRVFYVTITREPCFFFVALFTRTTRHDTIIVESADVSTKLPASRSFTIASRFCNDSLLTFTFILVDFVLFLPRSCPFFVGNLYFYLSRFVQLRQVIHLTPFSVLVQDHECLVEAKSHEIIY